MIEIIILFIILYYIINIYSSPCDESFDNVVDYYNNRITKHVIEYVENPATYTDAELKTKINDEVANLFTKFNTKYVPDKVDVNYATDISKYLTDNMQTVITATNKSPAVTTEVLKSAINSQLDNLLSGYITDLNTIINSVDLSSTFKDKREYLTNETNFKTLITSLLNKIKTRLNESAFKSSIIGVKGYTELVILSKDETNNVIYALDSDAGTGSPIPFYGTKYVPGKKSQKFYYNPSIKRLFSFDSFGVKKYLNIGNSGNVYFGDLSNFGDTNQYVSINPTSISVNGTSFSDTLIANVNVFMNEIKTDSYSIRNDKGNIVYFVILHALPTI